MSARDNLPVYWRSEGRRLEGGTGIVFMRASLENSPDADIGVAFEAD